MHDICFFNGQDITMNVCIQIHRVINLIQEQENIGFEEATGKFYHSQTYKTLTQVENGLWAENAEYILDCYNEEAKLKGKVMPSFNLIKMYQ